MTRPGCVKVESKGSFWWFDERAREYLRLPKQEGPREKAEWSDQRAGALQDAVWHPYESWELLPEVTTRDLLIAQSIGETPEPTGFQLAIHLDDETGVRAPHAEVIKDAT